MVTFNPNLGGGIFIPCWFSIKNSKTVKAVNRTFCSIYVLTVLANNANNNTSVVIIIIQLIMVILMIRIIITTIIINSFNYCFVHYD